MKVLLGSLVILATLVTSCNAQCYVQLLDIPPGQETVECKDSDGNTHPVNSTWEKDCVVCTCRRNEIGCCGKVAIPVGYDESKCEPIFHPDNCTYSVVERENPGKDCVVNSWIL